MSSIFKKGIFALFIRFFGALSNFLLSIYIARYLTKEDYGEYQLLITFVAGGSILARMGMDTYLMSKVPGEKVERKVTYTIQNSLVLVFIGSTILSILSFLAYLSYSLFYEKNISIDIALICISLFSYSCFMLISSIEKAKENINRSLCISNILPPALMFLVIELAESNANKLNNTIVAYLLSSFLVLLLSLLILIRGQRELTLLASINLNHTCMYFKRGIKYILHSLINYLLLWIDLIIIGIFLGGEYTADYSVASRVTLIILLAMSVYDGVVGPIIIKSYKNNATNKFVVTLIKIFAITFTFISFFVLVMIVFAEYVIPMFGDGYKGSIDLARILIAAYAIKGLASLPGYVLIAMNKVSHVNKILITSLLMNIILSYYLMGYYSIRGVAIGTLIASSAVVIASYYTMIHKLKDNKLAL